MGKAALIPIDNPEKVVKASNCIMGDGTTSVEDALNYSTTEHVVGEWIDGSTLYEKTVDCGALPNAASKNIPHGISNMLDVVSINCIAISSNHYSLLMPYFDGSNRATVYVETTNVNITTATSGLTQYNAYVTLRYTKTS